MEIGERMIWERKSRHLTRITVAREMGIAERTLWKLETGRQSITVKYLESFAYVIGCNLIIVFDKR